MYPFNKALLSSLTFYSVLVSTRFLPASMSLLTASLEIGASSTSANMERPPIVVVP